VAATPDEAFWLKRLKFRATDTNGRLLRSREIAIAGYRTRQLGYRNGWSDRRLGTRPVLGTDPGQGSTTDSPWFFDALKPYVSGRGLEYRE
jgi:hypothetical protein